MVLDVALGSAGNLAGNLLHALGGLQVIAHDVVHVVGKEVTGGAFDEVGFAVDALRGRLRGELLFHLAPLGQKHGEVAYKVAETLPLSYRTHDDAHALRHVELLHNLAQTLAFLRVINLAGDTELVGERHEHDVAARQGDVGGNAGALG